MAKFMQHEYPRDGSGGPKGPKGSGDWGDSKPTGGIAGSKGSFTIADGGTMEQKAKMEKVSR